MDLRLRRSPQRYREDVAACKDYLTAGDSYEICLTNRVVADVVPDPLHLYRALRRVNPAPFAAYLRFGDLAVSELLAGALHRRRSRRRGGSAADQGHRRRSPDPDEDDRLAVDLAASEKTGPRT